MSFLLAVRDETSSGEMVSSMVIQFPAETITVEELIKTRVAQEVVKYQTQKKEHFFSLVKPKDAEETLNGFRLKKQHRVDVEEQQRIAIRAFQRNGFFLLVNDRQLTELDDTILVTPNSKVVFLKLIPLVGG